MPARHQTVLRIAAVALLAAVALWPSSRGTAHAAATAAGRRAPAYTTAQAKRAERPRGRAAEAPVVAEADATH
ncbi:MAG TPA: hypothetical protein VIF62_22245 [Labilithrix sp.]|jgi:hypothetical protein